MLILILNSEKGIYGLFLFLGTENPIFRNGLLRVTNFDMSF
jgi:hypothetical protein